MAAPPPLNYHRPPRTISRERSGAARLARFVGMVSLVLGMGCLGLVFLTLNDPRISLVSRDDYLDRGLILTYLASMPIAGILYLIGGIVIRRPHHAWESALIITAIYHIGILLLMFGRLIFAVAALSGSVDQGGREFGAGVQLALALLLAWMLHLVGKLRKEID